MKTLTALSTMILAWFALAAPAAADTVTDAFYARCTTENSYQMQPAELDEACACMAPVLVSFLTPEARQEIESAIKANRSVSFSGSPFKGDPATLARSAIKQCPSVGRAMYQQNCTGANESAPQCQEMKQMLDAAP